MGNGIYFDKLQGGIFIGSMATAVHETDMAHLRMFRKGAHYFGFYSGWMAPIGARSACTASAQRALT